MAGFFVGLFFWIFIPYIIFRAVYRPRPDSTGGMLEFRGHEYGYIIGDNLYAYNAMGSFNGLDVKLPIDMPHIYLDSLKAGGRQVAVVFDPAQRIHLEGDFDNYFNVFVPRYFEAVALSILSPDVMETLEKYAAKYDVEIFVDHLRIICNRKILKDDHRQLEMMDVADKILKEIEDRQRSWTESDSWQAYDQDLKVYPGKGYRLFGRYILRSWFWMGVFWLMCGSSFILLGIYLLYARRYFSGGLLIVGALAPLWWIQYTTAPGRRGSFGFWSRRS